MVQHGQVSGSPCADAGTPFTIFNPGWLQGNHALMRETEGQTRVLIAHAHGRDLTPHPSSQPTRRFSRTRGSTRVLCARLLPSVNWGSAMGVKPRAAELGVGVGELHLEDPVPFLPKGMRRLSCADAGKAITSFRNRGFQVY